jgi:23S rRNA (cytidine1920-2'-O)/16S rRNA (cytidine1409-2'-O)-methyltransferase
VYAVDVGSGQLARKLVTDQRVVVMDRTNARNLQPTDFPEPIDWVVVDASFIGIAKLIDAIARVLPPGGVLLAMIKPQFEVGPEQARKHKGVIKDEALRLEAIDAAREAVATAGFELRAGCDSSLPGPKGNVEYFLYATRR